MAVRKAHWLRRGRGILALATAAVLVSGWACACGSSRAQTTTAGAQQRSAQYAAAQAAFRAGDYDRAINGFQALDDFSDARRRLAQVKAAAAGALLARARGKLTQGHPRAAVALAETATARYGDQSGAARALLAQAQRAQAAHHQQQLAGKAPG